MMKKCSGLIHLIANDRKAMDYFKTLPDGIKIQISKQPEKITTINRLHEEAITLLRNNT